MYTAGETHEYVIKRGPVFFACLLPPLPPQSLSRGTLEHYAALCRSSYLISRHA